MRHTLTAVTVAILLHFTLAGCATEPTDGAPEAPAVEVSDPDQGEPKLEAMSAPCTYVDAWLADADDRSLAVWFGRLELPPGACMTLACGADAPALKLCEGKGAPPIVVD